MNVLNFVFQILPHTAVGILSSIVMVASAICATVNTPKSKGIMALIYKIIDGLALNSSKAKQSGDDISDLIVKIRQDVKNHNWTGTTDELLQLLKTIEEFEKGIKPPTSPAKA